jgi:hypothetical protein
MRPRCDACRFYESDRRETGTGTCRYWPPTRSTAGAPHAQTEVVGFPRVFATDWCRVHEESKTS